MLINKLKAENSTITTIKSHGAGAHAINPGHSECPGKGCLHIVDAMRSKFRSR